LASFVLEKSKRMSFLPVDVSQRIQDVIEKNELVLLDIKQRGQRNTTVIEVIVDRREGNVDLDTLAGISRAISGVLDESEGDLPGRYRLEVSSAGLDRPLEHSWQYRKNVGRLLKISFEDETGFVRSELLRLSSADDDAIELVAPNPRGKVAPESRRIPLARVRKAIVEPEF
jgi:ribosome maturation factor RimP